MVAVIRARLGPGDSIPVAVPCLDLRLSGCMLSCGAGSFRPVSRPLSDTMHACPPFNLTPGDLECSPDKLLLFVHMTFCGVEKRRCVDPDFLPVPGIMTDPAGGFANLPMAGIALRPLPYLQSCADNDYRTAVDAAKELKKMLGSAELQQVEVGHLMPPLMNRSRALLDILSLGENVRQSEALLAAAAGEAQASLLMGEIALVILMSDERTGTPDNRALNICVEMAQCALNALLADWVRPTHAVGLSTRKPLVATNASAPTSTATVEELAAVLHSRLHQVLLMYLRLLWAHLPGGRKAILSSADGSRLEQPRLAWTEGRIARAVTEGADSSPTDPLLISLALQVSLAPQRLEGTGIANSRAATGILPSSQFDSAALLAMRILTSAAREQDGSARIIDSWDDFIATGGFGNGSEKKKDAHVKSRDPASLVMRLTSRYAISVTRCYRSPEPATACAEALLVATLDLVAALAGPDGEGSVGRVRVGTTQQGSGNTAAHRNPKWITRHLEVLAIAYLMADSLVLPASDTALNVCAAARDSARCRSALATICALLSELDSEEIIEVQLSTAQSALQTKRSMIQRPWDGELRILLLLCPMCRTALTDLGAKLFKQPAVDGSRDGSVHSSTNKSCAAIAWLRCLQGLSRPRDACAAIKSGAIQVSLSQRHLDTLPTCYHSYAAAALHAAHSFCLISMRRYLRNRTR